MIINADILRRDTLAQLKSIDAMIDDLTRRAGKLGVTPETMRDANGGYFMAPLMLAKVTAYSTLANLQQIPSRQGLRGR